MSCTFTPSRCHIRLGALVRNFSRMGRPDRLMPVIKSDAYGHGMTEVAHALDAAGARHFAVGTVAEGVCLRQDGLAQTILPLLGCQNDEDWQQANACGLTPLITGFEALEKAAALSSPADPWGVAIKLDTGMSRLGFSAEDIPALLERLRACPGLKPTLAVSHFPCADMPEKEDFTRRQLEKFTAMTDSLRAAYPALKRSLANSAGTMGWPESRFELCRPGFSLYGGNPFRGTAWEERGAGLEPVMEVSAPLLQVRHLKPGEGISYGQTFIAPREMSVAVVGAGYATGYPRGASGRIHVLVNGRRAPQVGRICMGMFMIDVTGLSARAGNLAWLLGGPAAPGETPVSIDELRRLFVRAALPAGSGQPARVSQVSRRAAPGTRHPSRIYGQDGSCPWRTVERPRSRFPKDFSAAFAAKNLTDAPLAAIERLPLLVPEGYGLSVQKEITMRKFETLLLLSPELSAETREGILTALTGVVERENGVMEEVDHWGMRDLAYPVRKQMRGYYVRLVYQAPAELVAELERNVRITDGIFKFVTVKLAEEVEVA